MASLGLVSHSRLPLRLLFLAGVVIGSVSFLLLIGLLILKLIYWHEIPFGFVPMMLVLLFFGGVQLLGLGILGEYIGLVLSQVKRRPLVIEEERINFDT